MTQDARYQASTEVVSCDLAGEAALLDLRTSRYFGLNGVGSKIWSHLTEPVSVATLRDRLTSEFDVDPARAEADVRELLTRLEAEQLVTVTGDAG